ELKHFPSTVRYPGDKSRFVGNSYLGISSCLPVIRPCCEVLDLDRSKGPRRPRYPRSAAAAPGAGAPAQAGGVLDELQSGAHGGGGGAATHVERDNRAEALELASRGRVSWVARQTGTARQSDVWMSREALGQCHRVALRPLQPQ